MDDGSTFNDEERAMLSTMVLDDSTPIPPSPTNRYADDPKAAELGHALFFDKRYITGNANCRSCHDLTSGGADTKTRAPTSVLGTAPMTRNTPTLFNVAFVPNINHWAGNFSAVWSVLPDVGTTVLQMAHFMYNDPYYRSAYESVFGPMPQLSDTARFPATGNYRTPEWQMMSAEDRQAMGRLTTNIGKAYEAYQRNMIDKNSPFDRYMNGDETAMSAEAIRGAKLFIGKAACNDCHNGPAFSDFKFHNIGVPQTAATPKIDYGFISAGAFQSTYPFNANSEFSDDPAYGASLLEAVMPVTSAELPALCASEDPPAGCGAFKTARLRSIALTAPYFHTGGFDSLRDVVQFYNQGVTGNYVGKRSAAIRPLYLTDDEVSDLVAFLVALTGAPLEDRWAKCSPNIPAEACMAP